MFKNRRFVAILIGLVLFAGASGLVQVFPGLQPYLPDIMALVNGEKGNSLSLSPVTSVLASISSTHHHFKTVVPPRVRGISHRV